MRKTPPKQSLQQSTIDQIYSEITAWRRLLDFFKEENIHLKNRLAYVLKNGIDADLLETLENFQNKFIEHDELAKLIKNDIAELNKLLNSDTSQNNRHLLNTQLANLRHNIQNLQNKFSKLQSDFSEYLVENVD